MILVLAILAPLLLLVLVFSDRTRRPAMALAPWAPLALLGPLMASPVTIELQWPLMLMQLGVDEFAHPLLLLTAVAWTASGVFARATLRDNQTWFWVGWLASLTGMGLLLLAADIASFYLGYAMLSLSAYLLITHARTTQAWRAGRIYLIMALLGEAAILAGLLLIAAQLGNVGLAELATQTAVLMESPARWLLLGGFAVKLGIVPLHLWLPLAHPAAPVPASAILSGVVVKAGLMGWVRLAPPSALEAEWLGLTLLSFGLATVFAGAILGVFQRRIKSVLAYSTVSQMGLILCAFSVLYIAPERSDLMLPVIGVLALHHGLNKAALFLACGCAPGGSTIRLVLIALPALSIAAAPLTSGFIAKGLLKTGAEEALPEGLWVLLISLTSTASILLMWRFWTLARQLTETAPLQPAWVGLTLLALSLPGWWAFRHDLLYSLTLVSTWSAVWPLLIGAGLLVSAGRIRPLRRLRVPEGDLVVVLEKLVQQMKLVRPDWTRNLPWRIGVRAGWMNWLTPMEYAIRRLPVAGIAILLVGGLLWIGAWLSGGS